MRTLLVGCGAIGGAVAAALTRAGHDVTILTGNPAIRDALCKDGLRVRELDGTEWSVPPAHPPAVHAAELLAGPPFDLCLLATKTTTLDAAAAEVRPLLSSAADVVCMQNGLPEERMAALFGADRVLGCVVGWGASLVEPGLSARTSRGGFQLGRLPGSRRGPDTGLLLAEDLLQAAGEVRIAEDLPSVRWSKLAINCATSTLGAGGGDTLGRLLRHRFVRRLALEVWSEINTVARACGVRMAKVAGTLDIERLALTAAERQLRLGSPSLFYKHSLLYAVGLKFRRMRSSMLTAIERGRRPEIDWLNGEVVRRGLILGIPTPINASLVALVHDIVARRAVPSLESLRAVYEGRIASSSVTPPPLPQATQGILSPEDHRERYSSVPRG